MMNQCGLSFGICNELNGVKASLSEQKWQAQWQQAPTSEEGSNYQKRVVESLAKRRRYLPLCTLYKVMTQHLVKKRQQTLVR